MFECVGPFCGIVAWRRVKQKVSPQLNQTEIELFEGCLTETEQLTSIKNIVHNWFPVNDGLTVIFVALRIRKKIDIVEKDRYRYRHIVVDLLKNKGGISSANFCWFLCCRGQHLIVVDIFILVLLLTINFKNHASVIISQYIEFSSVSFFAQNFSQRSPYHCLEHMS